jgi:hypothetical protein
MKEVDREAREQLRNGGYVDAVLAKQQATLRSTVSSLEEKMQAQREEGERRAAEAVGARRLAFLQQHLSNIGMGSSSVAKVIGTAQTIANMPGDLAGVARSIGADRAAGYLGMASGVIGDIAKRYAGAFGVAGFAVAATSQAFGYYEERSEEMKVAAKAESEAAMMVQRAAEGQAFGSKRAEHLLREIQASTEQGLGRAPLGWFDRIRSELGTQTAAQTEAIQERVSYVAKVEEARRQLGRSYDPVGNAMVRKRALRAFEAENKTVGQLAAGFSSFLRGVNVEEYNEDRWQKHLMASAEKGIEEEKERRVSEQKAWNNGLKGEINRVIDHEQRRQLRTVQEDNVARWNSWGMQ